VRTRTVSPSTHPRPASGGATDFLQASALFLPDDLAVPGREDARYVRPISATQSNCVYPRLARSRLLGCLRSGDIPRSLWLQAMGPGVRTFSRRPGRFGGSSCGTIPCIEDAWAWACSSHVAGCDRASDTPVATLIRPPPHRPSPVLLRGRTCSARRFVRVGGREPRLDRRYRALVKRTRITSVRDAFHR